MAYQDLTLQKALENFGQDELDNALSVFPSGFDGVELKCHQHLQAKAMRIMEKHRHTQHLVRKNRGASSSASSRCDTYFSHDLGVLATEAGSGKSLVCLLLSTAYTEVESDARARFYTAYSSSRLLKDYDLKGHVRPLTRRRYCFNTLLVVPPHLKKQWVEDTICDQARLSSDDYMVLTNMSSAAQDKLRSAAYAEDAQYHHGDQNMRDAASVSEEDNGENDNEDDEGTGGEAVKKPKKIIVMTATAYTSFLKTALFEDCAFQRVIIDEADSIHIKNFRFVGAHFTWLVTASAANLYKNIAATNNLRLSSFGHSSKKRRLDQSLDGPRQQEQQEQEQQRHYDMTVTYNLDEHWWDAITVSCARSFVAENVLVPQPMRRSVLYRRRALYAALQTSMTQEAIQALQAGDVKGAVMHMRCRTVNSEEGLVAAVTGRLRDRENDLLTVLETEMGELDQLRGLGHGEGRGRENEKNVEEQEALVRDLVEQIRQVRKSVDTISQRVREADVCPITMDPISTPAVTKCCQNRFEFSALLLATSRNQICPLCRSPMSDDNMLVLHNDKDNDKDNDSNKNGASTSAAADDAEAETEAQLAEESVRSPFNDLWSALDKTVDRIFRGHPDAKVLVFSAHDLLRVEQTVLGALRPYGAIATTPKGNANYVTKILDAFRTGAPRLTRHSPTPLPVRVLLLNTTHFGAGHNIEYATHIVTLHDMSRELDHQIVGRAQRWGRREPLHIIDIRMTEEEY